MTRRVLAIDLGASSGRIASIDLAEPGPRVEIVHRWANAPVPEAGGSLRWDWPAMVGEVERGLDQALAHGPAASIGVDGWGVDYGLVDEGGDLVAAPYSYRDHRTDGWREVADAIGQVRLYGISGIQLMGINTIFQLAHHDRGELDRAHRALLLPDLMVHHLTGFVGAERSNASTTGLLDARSGEWSSQLLDAISLPAGLLPDPVTAGVCVGEWKGVPVHLVGSHDTASAFLGMPGGGEPDTVFVSTGTWVIVGVERPAADMSDRARESNFSNEAGAFGGIRFLKNVIGFWLLERCRPGWGDPPIEQLFEEAAAVEEETPVFDARDERFVSPEDMEGEIREAAGLGAAASRGQVVRSIVESIAVGVARVVDELAAIGVPAPSRLAVTGGGARVGMFQGMLERHTGLPVAIGSAEATALGNAVAQGAALGIFPSLGTGRRWVGGQG
jgi:rhamnulokinase